MDIAILIGGKGTRTKIISKSIPKPFLKLNKKSITDDWKFLERHKVMRGDLSSKYNDFLSNFL